jgi:signal transduction histidine kinase
LRNAINFNKEGTITITKKRKKEAGSVIITIEDTGTGGG